MRDNLNDHHYVMIYAYKETGKTRIQQMTRENTETKRDEQQSSDMHTQHGKRAPNDKHT